ncbi:MAG: histidinol-phosphate transaminase [Bacteroidota bacterium]
MNIQALIRPHIRDLKPYSSARDEYSGKVGLFLDANENPLGSVGGGRYERYPDPHQREIKARLAQIKGVRAEQIFIGNGSDEAIDLLLRAFCEAGQDHILLNPPTYGMYKVSAEINGVAIKLAHLKPDYHLDMAALGERLVEQPKLTFLCSPNNPTGNLLRREDIIAVLQQSKGLVIVDEAYIDFAPEASSLSLLEQYPNLVVLQTFSKAWGMAGLRCGMAFGHPEVIAALNRIKAPYNVNQLTQEAILKALEQVEEKDAMVAEILAQRQALIKQLEQLSMVERIYPTEANFVLIKVANPNQLYDALIEKQIIIRNRSKVTLCEGCLRITIGTQAENKQLIKELKSLAKTIA